MNAGNIYEAENIGQKISEKLSELLNGWKASCSTCNISENRGMIVPNAICRKQFYYLWGIAPKPKNYGKNMAANKTSFKKGEGGRKGGVPNKVTTDLRQSITNFLENNVEQVQQD